MFHTRASPLFGHGCCGFKTFYDLGRMIRNCQVDANKSIYLDSYSYGLSLMLRRRGVTIVRVFLWLKFLLLNGLN